MHENEISAVVVDVGIEIHREIGPGLLESVYEEVLAFELANRGLEICRQVPIPVTYKSLKMEMGFRADLFVENKVIIEIKSVDAIAPIHGKQLLTYLRLSGLHLGLLMNFNVELMKNGIKRVVNNLV